MKIVAPMLVLFNTAVAIGTDDSTNSTTQPDKPVGVALLRQEAEAVRPLVESDLARQFLEATMRLPAIAPRTMYRNPTTREYYSKKGKARLSEAEQDALVPVEFSETVYYTTKYGTPLAFVRPLDLIGQNGVKDPAGKRVLDFGYGTVGQLRLMASLGADAVGVDVDPFLLELYSEPSDQGVVKNPKGRDGRITLVEGRWPADSAAKEKVKGGYDLIISKNTLKNGYLHPAQPVDKRMLIDLGVGDAEFVKALYAALKPGGKMMIYNICPAPSPPDEPYKPWSDGRCPFPAAMWEEHGFKVLVFDRDDSVAVRRMARAFGWDSGENPMDLENDLFAHYTLVERPSGK